MRTCGERFMDSLSLAVSGYLSIIKFKNANGLSRRAIEEGRDSRALSNDE
jgi:hypothetical protein